MTAPLVTRVSRADRAAVADAAHVLAAGGLVAFPTETVYGLGADATHGQAIARLYEVKGRPRFNPLIAHVHHLTAAEALAQFNADATRLAEAFWPGPLTLVLPKAPASPVADLATAGLDTIAVRVPAHEVAQRILVAFGKPVVAPSGNRIDLIVNAGATPVGVESTIVACIGEPVLLRPGGLPRGLIERALGRPLGDRNAGDATSSKGDRPLAPGMLGSHYAPRTPLRLNARRAEPGEALLAFGPIEARAAAHAKIVLNLSAGEDLVEAAANLFAHLRALDAAGARAIAVMPVPQEGLGEAVNDRLARAAAPRQAEV